MLNHIQKAGSTSAEVQVINAMNKTVLTMGRNDCE